MQLVEHTDINQYSLRLCYYFKSLYTWSSTHRLSYTTPNSTPPCTVLWGGLMPQMVDVPPVAGMVTPQNPIVLDELD